MMGRKIIHQEHSVAKRGKNIREGTRRSRAVSIFSISFFGASMALSAFLIVFSVMFFFSNVEGSSMMMTLNPNYTVIRAANEDAVVVNRRATPRRGDIIVVRYFNMGGVNVNDEGRFDLFIKRMIAMDGETVYFRQLPRANTPFGGHPFRYQIEVNGVPIDESYLDPYWGQNVTYNHVWRWLNGERHLSPYAGFIERVHYPNGILGYHGQMVNFRYEISVPRGYMFYMGDNRGGSGTPDDLRLKSWDSSAFGPQPLRHVVGVVADIVPENQGLPGYVFGRIWWFISFGWARG